MDGAPDNASKSARPCARAIPLLSGNISMSKAVNGAQSSDRLAGVLAIAAALASFALLAAHPGGQARTFAELVQEEARDQQQNLIVHGGYIVLGAIQILCFSFLSSRLSAARFASRAAIIFYAIGIAWLSLSLLFDGLVIPAIAVRYIEQTETVRPLFALLTAVIRFVMPIALGFQALAVCCWGTAMLSSGLRVSGAIASLLGLALVAAVGAGAMGGMPMAFMAAFAAMGLWGLIAGAALFRASPRV
jgi:hypothetical protein